MRKHWKKRLLAMFLSLTMLLSLVPGAFALDDEDQDGGLRWELTSNDAVSVPIGREEFEEPEVKPLYEDDEEVRVSIVLEEDPTLALFSMDGRTGLSADARDYREGLREIQAGFAEYISDAVLDEPLEVVENLTLVANIISANVKYGEIEAIEDLDGVAAVIVETRYEIQGSTDKADPNMVISTQMTGTAETWKETGYTGAGTRIAIIDTGLDIEHQSYDNDAFLHALRKDIGKDSATLEELTSEYDLLNADDIAKVWTDLNASEFGDKVTAAKSYYNAKLPFCVNYIDKDLDVTHWNDTQGEHGSHVAGIAAANRYIKQGDKFVEAMTADGVYMSGNAPDAQVLVMKVFGKGGGAYDSDYFAAIEDAIVLGCDTVNLSLGSGSAGMTFPSAEYQDIMDGLVSENTIVVMSAGNNSYWAAETLFGLPYSDDVNFHTGGSPGTYTNSLGVASVDNDGIVAPSTITAFGEVITFSETEYENKPIATLDPEGKGTEYEFVYVDTNGSYEDFVTAGVEGKVAMCNRGVTNFSVKAENALNAGAIAVIICNNQAGTINMQLDDYSGPAPVVSITKNDADFIKSKAIRKNVDGIDVYTGKLSIRGAATVIEDENGYKTMSDFSSWGVPGDLSLKPEITAPGGNIWSLNGLGEDHASYESMSGTSMAAPQITGIGALVKQAIEKRKISQEGLEDRALAQSLMMSTATPMKDARGTYYPVFQQGAGLVNTLAAVTADSYILMDESATASWADGKVKAELKDDPTKTGRYTVKFTINNLDGQAHTYALSADVFTQALTRDPYGIGYTLLHTSTMPLQATTVTWADAAGNSISGDTGLAVAANGSAAVTATITLDSTFAGQLATLCPNGFYVEAYLYATSDATGEGVQGTQHSIPVLGFYGDWTASTMFERGNYLDYNYVGSETKYPYMYGELGDDAFASNVLLYQLAGDTTSYAFGPNPFFDPDDENGDEDYLPARNALNSETGDKISKWYFMAIRNAGAARVLIRNAENTSTEYAETDLGEIYAAFYYPNRDAWQYTSQTATVNWSGKDKSGASLADNTKVELLLTLAPELYVNDDGTVNWTALGKGASQKMTLTIDNTAPVLKNVSYSKTRNELTVTLQDNQFAAYVALLNGEGTRILCETSPNQTEQGAEVSVKFDVSGIIGDKFMIRLGDYAKNQSTYALEDDLDPNMDLTPDIKGAYYFGYDQTNGEWVAYTKNGSKSEVVGYGLNAHITAGAYAKGYVFAFDDQANFYAFDAHSSLPFIGEGQWITVAEDLYAHLSNGDRAIDWWGDPICGHVSDMAYDAVNEVMYLAYYNPEVIETPYGDEVDYGPALLGTVDLGTGEITEVGVLSENEEYYAPPLTWALACDDEGTLYGVEYGARLDEEDYSEEFATLYKLAGGANPLYDFDGDGDADYDDGDRLLDVATGLRSQNSLYNRDLLVNFETGDRVNSYTGYEFLQKLAKTGQTEMKVKIADLDLEKVLTGFNWMTWDSYTNVLVLSTGDTVGVSDDYVSALYTVKPKTGKATLVVDTTDRRLTSLFVTPGSDADVLPEAEEASSVTLSETSLELVPGGSATLTATVMPWTLTDRSVTWTSSDTDVATVEDGVVTAVAPGTATITAASVVTSTMKATCTVNVANLDQELEALVWVNDAHWASFPVTAPSSWQEIAKSDNHYMAATLSDNDIYANLESGALYKVDPDTYESTLLGTIGGGGFAADMAEMPASGHLLGVYYYYILEIDPENPNETLAWDASEMLGYTTYFVACAYLGSDSIYDAYDDADYDVDVYALIDVFGDVYYFACNDMGYGWMEFYCETGYFMYPNDPELSSAVYAYNSDGEPTLFWTYYTGESSQLIAISLDGDYNSENLTGEFRSELGEFGDNAWPVVGLMTTDTPDLPASVSNLLNGGGMQKMQLAQQVDLSIDEAAAVIKPADDEDEGDDETEDLGETEVTDETEDLGETETADETEVTDESEDLEDLSLSVTSDAAASTVRNSTVTLNLKLDESSTNGKIKVEYDASALELVSVKGKATLNSANDTEDGVVVYAYAYKDAKAEGTTVATLTFNSLTKQSTTVTVTTLERGEGTNLEEVEEVPITFTTPSVPGPSQPGTPSTPSTPGTPGTPTTPTKPSTPAEPTDPEPVNPTEPDEPTTPTVTSSQFIDLVPNSWYDDYADYVIGHGLMTGTSETTFSPNDPLTRAMLVTILYRAASQPAVNGHSSFTDVVPGSWYDNGVSWASLNGLVKGYSDTIFGPDGRITRQELAVILWRYAQMLGISVATDGTTMPDFADRDEIAPWAAEAMAWAYRTGIITGRDSTHLAPNDGASRIEAAAMLVRFLNLVERNRNPAQ